MKIAVVKDLARFVWYPSWKRLKWPHLNSFLTSAVLMWLRPEENTLSWPLPNTVISLRSTGDLCGQVKCPEPGINFLSINPQMVAAPSFQYLTLIWHHRVYDAPPGRMVCWYFGKLNLTCLLQVKVRTKSFRSRIWSIEMILSTYIDDPSLNALILFGINWRKIIPSNSLSDVTNDVPFLCRHARSRSKTETSDLAKNAWSTFSP